jgi:hypothetical protein
MSELVNSVIDVLAAGATAGLKDTATQAVKDAYATLKQLLRRKISNLRELEREPSDAALRRAAEQDLLKGEIDSELKAAIRDMVSALEGEPRAHRKAWGIEIEKVRAAGNVVVADLEGSSVRISDVEARAGDVSIRAIKSKPHKKK